MLGLISTRGFRPPHFLGDNPMQRRRDVVLNTPALMLVAGNFDRKPRSLDRDVTTIGRARGSDLCLEANEISTLHCVIYRTPEGYRIRDCNSRCGTRINGEAIKSARLHHGDLINIGLFTFEFHLPAPLFANDGKVDPVQVEHLKRSRRKLAQLALKKRKRLSHGAASAKEQEWANKGNVLKEKIRCYDQRLRELEDAEKELTDERHQLESEAEKQRQRIQSAENQLTERLAQADEDIRQRWQQFQQRCQNEEFKANRRGTDIREPSQIQDQEIEQLRRHLRDIEEQLARQQEQLLCEQSEFTTMKEQWVKAQSKSSEAIQDQQSALASQESAVRAQKAELTRMMGELKRMQEDLRKQAKSDVRALHEELERTRAENVDLRTALEEIDRAGPSAGNADVVRQIDELKGHVKDLRKELDAKEAVLQGLRQSPGADGEEIDKLRAENDLLKKLLEENDRLVMELTNEKAQPPKTANDLERYETELNEFRRQLEVDRTKLNTELESLRERNQELDAAVREMEMELSKERAELGRERMRLERVREEVKTDMEKLQREASVRDSMASVHKLREELTGKQGASKGDKINDRLYAVRNQMNEAPSAGS
jgi:pSer/pThr/pTyr-binding forkhead associated (FHA) protein